MAASYPKDEKQRHQFWMGQLLSSQKFVEPYMEAGVRLVKMYNNLPANERERILSSIGDTDNDERVKASLVFSWVDQSVAGMVGEGDIDIRVKPRNALGVQGAPVCRANVNYWYGETEQVCEDEAIALDAHLMPYAVKRLGWTFDIDENGPLKLIDVAELFFDDPEGDNLYLVEGIPTGVRREQNHREHIPSHKSLLSIPEIPTEIKSLIKSHIQRHEEFQNNIQPEPHAMVRYGAPFGRRWPPDDFLMDSAALMDQKDARWIAFRIRQPVYRWQADETFSNTEDLRPNCGVAGKQLKSYADRQNNVETEFDEFGLCEGWEIWARDFPVDNGERINLRVVLIETHEKLLFHGEWEPEYTDALDDYPVEIVKFQDNIKTWINKPTLVLAGADNMQTLQNEFLDSMLYTMRKDKNVFLVDAEVDLGKVSNIADAEDGTFIRVEGLAQFAGKVVYEVPRTQINNDKTQMLSILRGLFDQSAGTPEPLRQKSSDTATEAAINERRNTAREDRRFLRFRRMQVNTARKWWQLQTQVQPDNAEFIDPRTNKVMKVTPEVAKGEYRFEMDVMPKRTSEAVQQNNELKFYNMIAGTLPIAMQMNIPINFGAVIEDLLLAFGKKDIARYLPNGPDDFMASIQEQLNDPAQKQQLIEMLQQFGAGGMGMGNGPGPAVPQLFTSQPTTESRNQAEVNRLEG